MYKRQVFEFGLFQIRVEKIVFRTQNFRTGSGRVYGSDQFLPDLVVSTIKVFANGKWSAWQGHEPSTEGRPYLLQSRDYGQRERERECVKK